MDELFVNTDSFGITSKAPDTDSGILMMDSPDDLEVLKFTVEYLQTLGKKMDEYYLSISTDQEDYRERTKMVNLLKDRTGKEYLIIAAFLGMLSKTPQYAKVLVQFMEDDKLFVELMSSIDIELDPQTNSLKLNMDDSVLERRNSNLIIP